MPCHLPTNNALINIPFRNAPLPIGKPASQVGFTNSPMHRKRGDSLEQGLVMPSPLSSRTTDSRQQQQAAIIIPPPPMPMAFPSDGCISRVPYSSLAAFLFCLFGVILFTTMMVWAFNASVEQIRRATYMTDLPWLDKVQLLFIVSALAMIVIVLAFLLIGLLSTGPTRENVFQRQQARRGGRISSVVAICLATALNIIWMLILALTAILCFVYIIFSALCSNVKTKDGHSCLNFAVFKSLLPTNNDASLEFCDGQLQQFCAVTNTVVIWYIVGALGSLLICIGLVQFIATNAANYAHIGNEARYSELREVMYAEMTGNSFGCYPLGQLGHDRIEPISTRRRSWHDKQPINGHYMDYSSKQFGDQQFDNRAQDFHMASQQKHRQSSSKQQQQKPALLRDKKSTGAVLGNHRRHSYQNSLSGSNNWLNEMEARVMH